MYEIAFDLFVAYCNRGDMYTGYVEGLGYVHWRLKGNAHWMFNGNNRPGSYIISEFERYDMVIETKQPHDFNEMNDDQRIAAITEALRTTGEDEGWVVDMNVLFKHWPTIAGKMHTFGNLVINQDTIPIHMIWGMYGGQTPTVIRSCPDGVPRSRDFHKSLNDYGKTGNWEGYIFYSSTPQNQNVQFPKKPLEIQMKREHSSIWFDYVYGKGRKSGQ